MSCSVVAIPWAIAWIVGGIASQAAIAAAAGGVFDDGGKALMKALETNKGEVCDSLAKQFLEKSFETPFVDKELLFKTLEEGIKTADLGGTASCSGFADAVIAHL